MAILLSRRGMKARSRRRAVSGILAAVILFSMLFFVGIGYLISVNQASQVVVQANAARQGAELASGKESLALRVTLSGGGPPNYPVVVVNNTGGTSSVVSYIYVTDLSGKLLSSFMGPNPTAGTNATALWPISLSPGQSTSILKGCVAGKTGCNIELTGYAYSGTPVMVEVVTRSGNTFSAQYPNAGPLNQANPLVVSMVATPPQVFSCSAPNCITLTVTVYNYATSPVTNLQLNPVSPTPLVTGTAGVGVSGGSCGAPVPSSTIPAYVGGNPSNITITCSYSATTGPVGGFASFSGGAQGKLGAGSAASADAISNTIQIGGNSNVPTQGAFAANYFFVKYSACQNGPSGTLTPYTYSYSSHCNTTPATMPPASLNSLTSGNYISGFSDFYVAYYVQVTNTFNTTLPILDYSYLFSDPGISPEAYSFLVGAATTPYFPNYCNVLSSPCAPNNIPQLTAYTATAATCTSNPSQCIEVAPGQTVTLTFAACGYGSTNWVWGGTPYAPSLDNTNGCITTPPEFIQSGTGIVQVPEGQTLSIVLSYMYKNQVYLQSLPFEGQTVTNLRTTSTAMSCSPATDPVNAPTTCTVTVTDLSPGTPVTPTGTITLSQTPVTGGTFGGTCTLSGAGATATCSVTYTPSLGQEQTDALTATYAGDTFHSGSSGQTTVTATQRATSTSVVCNPTSAVPNTPTNCVITVTDSSPGTTVTPTGTVTLSDNPASSGTFAPTSTCTLSSGSCSVTYTPNSGLIGTVTIQASYGGDTDHAISSGSTPVKWARLTSTTVSCVPNSLAVGSSTSCTATVTDTSSGSPTTPTGTVTFTQSAPASGTFVPASGQCTLVLKVLGTATCSVSFTPGAGQVGTATISASYPGDGMHLASSGSTPLTVTKATTTTIVTCSGATCTATVSGFVGSITAETVTFSQNGGTGTITFPAGTTCTLSGASCSVQVTGTATGSPVVKASYPGDSNNLASSGTLTLTIHADTITVACVPNSFNVNVNSVCTATLNSFTAPVTGETVTFSQSGGTGSVTFVSTTCTLSAGGTCQVTITGKTAGTPTIQASYPGDSANVKSSGTTSVTVTKHATTLVQSARICTNPGTNQCSITLTVTSGDVMVVTVSTEIRQTTCTSVTSISGTRGDSSYSAASGGSVTASNSGLPECAYSAIYYAAVTTGGSDTITVQFNDTPDSGVVNVYEVASAITPPTAASGSCNNGACSLTVATSSLPYASGSFLVTSASDCPSPSGFQRNIVTGPSGFTTDYGTGNAQYVGHEFPGSAGSTTFQMTSSTGGSGNPVCWAVVGAQFPDPPPPTVLAPASITPTTTPTTVVSHSGSPSWDPSIVAISGVNVLSLLVICPHETKVTSRLRPVIGKEEKRTK